MVVNYCRYTSGRISNRWVLWMTCVSVIIQMSRVSAMVNYTTFNVSGTLADTVPHSVPVAGVAAAGVTVTEADFSSNSPATMEWMARLFDHHAWKIEYLQNASHVCAEHIAEYLQELRRGTSWATKMYDASGRYNGQFFFGNDFWLGSSTLCMELGNSVTNPVVPPFRVHFNVAKVHLTLNNLTSRQLMIGQCLPEVCTPSELKGLLQSDAARAITTSADNSSSIDIVHVRPVPGTYDILTDIKFYIVGGTLLIITTLVVTATLYETCLNSRKHAKLDSEIPNEVENNNELKDNDIAVNGTDKDTTRHVTGKGNHTRQGIHCRLLLCFSALSNGQKILEVDRLPQDSIKCVHGLRFLSVAWVILVHTYLEVFAIAENKTLRVITERFFIYQTISNATFSVDTFFFISGLLVTILYFRTAKQKPKVDDRESFGSALVDSSKRFLLLIFYRVVRLTPAYLFVLGVHEIVIRYIHNSSVFEPNFYDHVTCDKYWWRNALYINTWYPQKEICMLWSWYMSNDTQFYILAVIILLIAVRGNGHLKVAAGIVVTFLLASWITTFIIAYRFDYHARIEEPFALFDQLYDKPWMRLGPYLIGMAAGWLLYRTNFHLPLHRLTVVFGWLLSMVCLLSLVYGVGKEGLRVPLSAAYATLGHSAWGAALAWITVACCTGHGGWVDQLLSFRGFLPFSRLTYCAYLLHPMVMCVTSFQMDGPIHLHNGLVLVIYFGNVVVAFLLSFVISLGFEAPVVRLLKIIVAGRE